MASSTRGLKRANVTPVAEKSGMLADIKRDSTPKENKRRNVGEDLALSNSSGCWCGGFTWGGKKICPKEICGGQGGVSSMENLENPFDSDRYANTKKEMGSLLSPREQSVVHCHSENGKATNKNLDAESLSRVSSSSGEFGSVTEHLKQLLNRKKNLISCSRTLSFTTCQEDLGMEKSVPKKGNTKSNCVIPEFIDLEDDDEPPEKGATAQSGKAGENAAIVPSGMPSGPVVMIDLDEYEDLGSEKDVKIIDVLPDHISSRISEDQDYAGHQGKREGKPICTHQTENETTPVDDKVIDLDCAEDQISNGENASLSDEPECKTDSALKGCCQSFAVHDENLSGAQVLKSKEENSCYDGETEVQKREDTVRKSNFNLAGNTPRKTIVTGNMEGDSDKKLVKAREQTKASSNEVANDSEVENDKGEYVGVEDDADFEEGSAKTESGDGQDLWNEMSFALESSKDLFVESFSDKRINEDIIDCDHQFIFKEDIGSVCRVCGLIDKAIHTIIEYQFEKAKRSGRTYKRERTLGKASDLNDFMLDDINRGENDSALFEIAVHPRHQKSMKPHQTEGFNFLASNLMTDHPGGCVMAHAPGSGKTFLIISFLQSFMAKFPSARPLIVLPKGLLSTWRKEFQRWQVEDMPLYDFYSSKADSRSQQLEVLQKWANERSILFLGYQQFAMIIYDTDCSKSTRACQKILITFPSILIMDEGHTPRNKNTEVLKSLERVETRRKVILSGTLYQNHVEEVFNVLNLVRPKFLESEPQSSIKRRILSKVQITSRSVSNSQFYDLVERTIVNDTNSSRKVNIIRDLREMTSNVLHYHKGDSLDELPGLVDFTVFLKLTRKQQGELEKLKKCKERFRIVAEGSLIYMHPRLNTISKRSGGNGYVDVEKIDLILEDLTELGVKARFYLNLLQLCESRREKLLVFSQYLAPMKLLERLTVKEKNYSVGKEIFVITGETDSYIRDSSMEQFNTSSDARVFFGSIKACGEGISLIGASRIVILDVHLNPSVTRQAIGRAFRPGQEKKVYTYRLVASGSPEEEDNMTSFRKECIAKMMFEWNTYQSQAEFQMKEVDVNDCGDIFLESPHLKADVVSVYTR